MEILRENQTNAAALNARLNELGYDCPKGDVFTRQTAWAVHWFRRRNGLDDGDFADEAFMAALNNNDARPGAEGDWQYYSMKDALWAQYPYDAANTPEIERMENSACGPTSMAMAVSTLLHRAVLPPVLADWSNAHGFRDPDGIDGTSDDFFPACAEQYGLTAELVKLDRVEGFARIAEELRKGSVVICNVVPGSPYTRCGHYNLIQRIEDGRVYISDPVPRNCDLPAYTVAEWAKKGFGRHCLVVRREGTMKKATADFLKSLDERAEARRQAILSAPDRLEIVGQKYYVAENGDDENDGCSPGTAWRSLKKASEAPLQPGDGVLFRRGDLFRGQLVAQPGVAYGAFGEGEKPRLYAGDWDLADPALWELWDEVHSIWRCRERTLDAGTLVFNGGEKHSRKLIPSYLNGGFVCRDNPEKAFDVRTEMTQDLDIFSPFTDKLTTQPSRGENFPIPAFDSQSYGELYLRCDAGNPGEIFDSIEVLAKRHLIRVGSGPNVRIDNLCLKYTGEHAIGAGGECVKGLHVTNCEIGWIGGSIQHYLGTDPNYPQGGRGTVTRYGNGVEIYGGCDDYEVSDCWIYQCYDAGITHQISTFGREYHMNHIVYRDNLVEYCVYSIEYFLEKTEPGDSEMSQIDISGNFLRFSGYGWGQQRHNTDTPAHIKGWSYENTASEFFVHDNIFDRAGYRMLHLVALKPESCPEMARNTYVQTRDGMLGQYGANELAEPEILPFDENADRVVSEIFGDQEAEVFIVD